MTREFRSASASITQVQPSKTNSMPTNVPMTQSAVSGHSRQTRALQQMAAFAQLTLRHFWMKPFFRNGTM